MKIVFASLALWAASVWGVCAEPVEIGQVAQGPIYYNRPHATVSQHDADLAACMATAPLPTSHAQMLAVNTRTGMTYDVTAIWDLVWAGPIAGLRAARVENCMLLNGWRAVRLSQPGTARLNALPQAEFVSAMAQLIAADRPEGEVIRIFANEALRPADYHTASRPAPPSKDHLSLKLFYLDGGVYPTAPAVEKPSTPSGGWSPRPIKLEAVSSAPAGSAIVVLRVTGISNRYGTGVSFSRVPTADGEDRSGPNQGPELVSASIGYLFAKREGNWFVLAVPPGRWRIAGSGFVDYCLGSPSFEAKPGDVIYAGTFHLEGPVLGPDLDLTQAKQYLPDGLASRVVAASYRNGASQPCKGYAVTYGLEFPGVPFASDYSGGSVALAGTDSGGR